jgi:hypothetical protein
LGFARPSETFFGHGPIFGGRLHGKMYLLPAQFAAQISPDLSALARLNKEIMNSPATDYGGKRRVVNEAPILTQIKEPTSRDFYC